MTPGYDVVPDGAVPCDPIRREPRPMLTMYSTSWCGYCHRLKSQLDREGIAYEVVDIEKDPAAADFVMSVNGGNQTVPTIRIVPSAGGEEIVMTNPSIVQVKSALAGT